MMMPWDLLSQIVDWIMRSPDLEWFMFGLLVGMFMMFSILTGYWLVLELIIKRFKRWQ